MKHSIKKPISSIVLTVLGFLLFSHPAAAQKFDVTTMRNEDLVSNFESGTSEEITGSAIEIFKRGEKMIPLLIKLKGKDADYSGYCLGDPNEADGYGEIPGIEGSRVTIEVASLYLINAIYFDNLAFANVPYITDRKQDKVRGFKGYRNYNTSKRIEKAWKSTGKWYQKLQEVGIKKLRKDDQRPFRSAKIYFVGTNSKREKSHNECFQ